MSKHTINISVTFARHGPNAPDHRARIRRRIREIRAERAKWAAEEGKR